MVKKVELKINGEKISLSEFPEEFIKNTIFGMISSLKGVDKKLIQFLLLFQINKK